jgi:catechol 2,3-dioxygenase-like lactoylglutathione lyase family enzyme
MNFKLELVIIPVTDVDRAKAFYEQAGFVLDHDHVVNDDVRFVQFTPPGSACSIALGTGLTDAPAGSARTQVVVDNAEAACQELRRRGVKASDVEVFPWGSFTSFADPDGNRWSVQQVPPRNRS